MSKKLYKSSPTTKIHKKEISDELFSRIDLITQINGSITDNGFFIVIRDRIQLDTENKEKAKLLLSRFKEILQIHRYQINTNFLVKKISNRRFLEKQKKLLIINIKHKR